MQNNNKQPVNLKVYKNATTGGEPPDNTDVRLTRLEIKLDQVEKEISEMKQDIREIRNEIKSNFKWIVAILIASILVPVFLKMFT